MRTPAEAKAQARTLRRALAASGHTVSHAEALELVAHQNGARDWNTLNARLMKEATGHVPLHLNGTVRGRYLGQPFTGRIVSLSQKGDGYAIAIQLDQPVDTVQFASFSNLRRRINGSIGRDGRSVARTSDGFPQLIVERDGGRT